MNPKIIARTALFILLLAAAAVPVASQENNGSGNSNPQEDVRVMTIPVSIFTDKEIEKKKAEEFIAAGEITVREDGDLQQILSIRSVTNQPVALAILIQDDLTRNINNQLRDLAQFILNLPKGSRVMVAYVKSGSLQVRQKFTTELEEAADSLRIVAGTASAAPRNPYDGVIEALRRFEGVPSGRRAILLISDGLDVSSGVSALSPGQSLSLDQATLKAQRSSVAVYCFYASATFTSGGNSRLVSVGQGSLLTLAKETGGKAFFQGSLTPVSFRPFFRDLDLALTRQFALSYLSTHLKKGYHKVDVTSSNPEVRIDHPKGYYYRKPR